MHLILRSFLLNIVYERARHTIYTFYYVAQFLETAIDLIMFVYWSKHCTYILLLSFWTEYYKFRDGDTSSIAGFLLPGDETNSGLMMSAVTQPMAVNSRLVVDGDNATLHWGVG